MASNTAMMTLWRTSGVPAPTSRSRGSEATRGGEGAAPAPRPGASHMASLRLRLYSSPASELAHVRQTPVSGPIEALGQSLLRRLGAVALVLRKAEARGWAVRIDGDAVVVATGQPAGAAREALEHDGVWHLVRRLAGPEEVFL